MNGVRLAALSAVVVAVIVLGGSAGLWVALPLAWLYLRSQVEAVTGSLAAGLGGAMLGFVVSAGAALVGLGWLSRRHGELRKARGRDDHGGVLLEGVVFLSAVAAVGIFGVWFRCSRGLAPSRSRPEGDGENEALPRRRAQAGVSSRGGAAG